MRILPLLSLGLPLFSTLARAAEPAAESPIDRYGQQIFKSSRAIGMTMVVIDKHQTQMRFYGETRSGSRQPPNADSLVRIASISKAMTGEVLTSLALERKVRLDDPLQKYAPAGLALPAAAQPITLLNLATHTSGVPREMPGEKPQDTPVFVWPNVQQRWSWLAGTKNKLAPGQRAQYSNLGFDLLADALSRAAGKPYPMLFQEKITTPLGMKDTTFHPSAAQCARLMEGYGASPCVDTTAAIGSGGIYSTPRDMQRWLQELLYPQNEARRQLRDQTLRMHIQRAALGSLRGMDVAGQADQLGLAWIRMEPSPDSPEIIQKTAGGGGFLGYAALAPRNEVAVWVGLTRSGGTRYQHLSNGVNRLVAELSGYKPAAAPVPAPKPVSAKVKSARAKTAAAHAKPAAAHAKKDARKTAGPKADAAKAGGKQKTHTVKTSAHRPQ
ncbi:D-alanyl-D-alanine-carboxypeptidase/endopeptidase AmpH [Chromobacterium phragmitis]|uniref:D-alanyl-D-alanine- carboxypeptidase/endopeptidase AmpH n=1 Tax=Chromobacterium phragmitis TaxID=2202141 RepID=UPI000DEC9A6A|nr:D-alanyl-D-alanine-carboxypeptidase/endopeptidase AmpH [Chromobacterium phragmitis]AXE32145.1 D-alanyl-D-alanine-carboxypeptidase/endopeptidase AmpH [Chromobacterium phragmitis]